ncbi:MAG: HEAT repeat domain-containing protein [Thermodesulfobacteriota bacterium]|nr:HEAT repeat domain-containing protein [Thermodesulfobacteriota bacterium]
MSSGRAVKEKVFALLGSPDWDQRFKEFFDLPLQKVVGPLFSSLCNSDPLVKWRGVTAFGLVVPRLADSSMEKARIVMRRFIWSLNDESGGIGWGAPEAMGEITANHEKLAEEYHAVLCSYIHEAEGEGDTFLELPLLRRGAVWGIARLAQARPDMAARATGDLIETLHDEDAPLRGLACLALGRISASEAREAVPEMEKLIQDSSPLEFFQDGKITKTTVSDLAREALAALG